MPRASTWRAGRKAANDVAPRLRMSATRPCWSTLALTADIAETRQEAAERVHSPEALRKLSHAAKNKDRGVARLARQRIGAMTERAGQAESADAMLTELEALAGKPGPIVSAMVDLDRRWQGLAVTGDDARLARWAEARAAVQARFDREQDEQRGRAQFERRLREWLDALPSRRDDAIRCAAHGRGRAAADRATFPARRGRFDAGGRRAPHWNLGARTRGAGRGRGAGGRSGTARRRNVDRPRGSAGPLGGARSKHARPPR